MIIIDAKDGIVGRVATLAAKQALLGEDVAVINCELAIITGNKKTIIADWKRRYAMGVPKKGPFIHRVADRLVRRIIRGMLPYKNPRGIAAFRRVMCYVGEPKLTGERMSVKSSADLPNAKFMTVGALCKALGGEY